MKISTLRRALELFLLILFILGGSWVVFKSSPIIPTTSPPITQENLKEAMYYSKLRDSWVQCNLCFRNCTIPEGGRGFCLVRVNKGGKLYSLVYNLIGAIQVDPVEKEPLLHFLPGTKTLCFGTAGCNFRCIFCHNWSLATRSPEEVGGNTLTPEEAVDTAINAGCQSISFTYNEPTVFYEWVYEVAKIAKTKGVRVYFHTNGAINPEPLRRLLPYLDAVCLDLKAFTTEFYQYTSVSDLAPVLNTLKIIKEKGVWLEITNLVIPTLNDDMVKIKEMCVWIKDNLGKDVPVHFTRFYPAYKLTKLSPTSIETLEKAYEIAKEVGLEYVTIGNVPGHKYNSTFCPSCKERVIWRVHFEVMENNLKNGRCGFCDFPISGVWK